MDSESPDDSAYPSAQSYLQKIWWGWLWWELNRIESGPCAIAKTGGDPNGKVTRADQLTSHLIQLTEQWFDTIHSAGSGRSGNKCFWKISSDFKIGHGVESSQLALAAFRSSSERDVECLRFFESVRPKSHVVWSGTSRLDERQLVEIWWVCKKSQTVPDVSAPSDKNLGVSKSQSHLFAIWSNIYKSSINRYVGRTGRVKYLKLRELVTILLDLYKFP